MLFSAGTFLYVATVHVLPELTHPQSHTHTLLPMQDGSTPKKGFGGLLLSEMIILTVGALMPLLLTMGHKHWSLISNVYIKKQLRTSFLYRNITSILNEISVWLKLFYPLYKSIKHAELLWRLYIAYDKLSFRLRLKVVSLRSANSQAVGQSSHKLLWRWSVAEIRVSGVIVFEIRDYT